MLLYLCSKIVEENLTADFKDQGYFYPVIYPKKVVDFVAKKDVLLKTIKSYSTLEFSKTIFRIEFNDNAEQNQKEILDLIFSIWPRDRVDVRFSRPSTVNEWLDESIDLIRKYGGKEPVVVAMNHDHPFVDYNPEVFGDIVKTVFDDHAAKGNRALYYSHAPEVITWLMMGRGKCKFHLQSNGVYRSNIEKNWVDSIVVITFETFNQIWQSIRFDGDYIGRFDWKNVSHKNLNIVFFAVPREFFRHYDGYSHTTGVRLSSNINIESCLPFRIPNKRETKEIIAFYYQIWKDNYLHFLEADLEEKCISLNSEKQNFINSVGTSVGLFEKYYLNYDLKYKIINEDQKVAIINGLYNAIYFDGNILYQEIVNNRELKNNIFKTPLFKIFKRIRSWISFSR
jgi:hypothetical protein